MGTGEGHGRNRVVERGKRDLRKGKKEENQVVRNGEHYNIGVIVQYSCQDLHPDPKPRDVTSAVTTGRQGRRAWRRAMGTPSG